ncbi:glycosyl transferase [Kosmotoga pacifica]|uniref:Glycosyltransferase n=1 Tax=Kosmotoga pacifica TaxID=1330330 RepID=A0A0G2ZD50_9BACT|nr:glycosyl transferase [Kosmotoga pacifica]AKI97479.1 glycosyltransferase [Kosmotoga pacifica]
MYAVPEEIQPRLSEFKGTKIVVGIPSYNNAETIAYVAEVAARGIEEYFGGKGLIVNSDGGSTDGTIDAFLKADTGNIGKLAFQYIGLPGKGSAMRSVMEIAAELRASVTIFLDSDLRSVQPWWLERLGMPIIEGKTSYITPYYIRHKYDGTITNNICYPLTSALYGLEIRQPIGGDFGVGLEMIDIYMNKPNEIWKTDVAKFGIDIWMTTTAINESKFKPMQAALGAKIHDVKDPGKHLGPMFSQVVGTLFSLVEQYNENWTKVSKIEETEIYGDIPDVTPEPLEVDLNNLITKTKSGIEENLALAEKIMPSSVLKTYKDISNTGKLNEEDWVSLIYELASLYRKRELRESIIKLLIPAYFGRVADFVEKTLDLSTVEAEEKIKEMMNLFLKRKGEFVRKW